MSNLRVVITRIEYRVPVDALGLDTEAPRLTWIATTDVAEWMQSAYEIEVDGVSYGRVEGDVSLFVPWPAPALTSRSRHVVRVRVWGTGDTASSWSAAVTLEAGLLTPDDWVASWISTAERDPLDRPAPAPAFRKPFVLAGSVSRARLYATSAGVHRLEVNGAVVGNQVLAPGWTSYRHRLHYETYDVADLLQDGANVLGAVVADGWWRGYLTWEMERNVYGARLGLLAQLEIAYDDGTTEVIATSDDWTCSRGPMLASDLYNGETYDARLERDGWSQPGGDDTEWDGVEVFAPTVGALVARVGPPIRRTEHLPVQEVLTTPSGRTILDFGQNMVGRVRFSVRGPAGTTVTLRHAEVLEHGELGTRPLRNAEATDRYTLRGGDAETWEPEFTFHGFRFVEVDGWPGVVEPQAFTGIVIHSDLDRTGTFSCSNELLNRLHENVVWGMRGNFVGVPTDCPQRDERLGWTGDLQVFGPTAAFLYDVDGFLSGWLTDLACEQTDDGTVPIVVPDAENLAFVWPAAAWGDAATIVPWTLYERYGDVAVLERQLDSMRAWVDHVAKIAGPERLWRRGFQFGDWLDPDAPPDKAWAGKTDPSLVATAYFARSAQIVGDCARVLQRPDVADEYTALAAKVRAAFRDEFVTPNGRLLSDSPTAYALALAFDLLEHDAPRAHAIAQLARAARKADYRIATGFVGTPIVLPALSNGGDHATAYRLLTETGCPSWLYPVTMGATTIWERWDSMLPDGSINPGEMTSFNHYALGSVADWMHRTIGGLSPDEPGYRRLRIAPVPGAGVTSAHATLVTPYGPASTSWVLEGAQFTLEVTVPANTTAVVKRPGLDEPAVTVGAGSHRWTYQPDPNALIAWSNT